MIFHIKSSLWKALQKYWQATCDTVRLSLQRVFADVPSVSSVDTPKKPESKLPTMRIACSEPAPAPLIPNGRAPQAQYSHNSRPRIGFIRREQKRDGNSRIVGYATGNCPIGRLLVATTDRGICWVNVADNDEKLILELRKKFPRATTVLDERVAAFVEDIGKHLRGECVKFPLDIRGTGFQLKVWTELGRIPLGETRSYSELAQAVGSPRAYRAVANACASNPVPLILPCHRVIRSDGTLGGYGLGVSRKRDLLEMERALKWSTAVNKHPYSD